jgi:hypothetical protein
VLALYDRMTEETATKVVHKWQRTSIYLSAIRDLELGPTAGD